MENCETVHGMMRNYSKNVSSLRKLNLAVLELRTYCIVRTSSCEEKLAGVGCVLGNRRGQNWKEK